MQYRENKKNGDNLSILGLGCMRLPHRLGSIDTEKSEKLIMKAIEGGVNFFDTAYIYSGSEAVLGSVLENNTVRDKVKISTKLPGYLCKNAADFDKFLNIQLSRMKTDYIDYYFIHMLSNPSEWDRLVKLGITDWLEEKKTLGAIKNVGFSFHGKQKDFPVITDAYDWDFCMVQYNYININYQAGMSGVKYASGKGIPVFVMEPLLGGRLADGLPQKARDIFNGVNPEYSPAGWAFRWLWDQPEITLVLSGMNAVNQLDENISLAGKSLPDMLSDEEKAAYDEVIKVFGESYRVPCTGCNYCMPCPAGVNIPSCFMAYNTSYAIGISTGIHQYMTGASVASPKKNQGLASRCVNCGKCEKHCPQGIKIREELKNSEKRLEPFWVKTAAFIAGKFLK